MTISLRSSLTLVCCLLIAFTNMISVRILMVCRSHRRPSSSLLTRNAASCRPSAAIAARHAESLFASISFWVPLKELPTMSLRETCQHRCQLSCCGGGAMKAMGWPE